ncbi:flagellar biosynthesis anti-sigma factor FlgM [Thalassomonas haliotis]|uniref:Negative regulator of flagellin synthesis n=1 Tax=Thalassomonas haliotis TaxID=485448 RepID=A0ABY7VJ65_9GAMM|nr:flagellar biosynthesis anti-sigma factor FlgM [Thalassomonas haliotis]WDE13209.1 flagellar biosynthesis anti-sigma factor FlgM [Thalassomonas haliotis]
MAININNLNANNQVKQNLDQQAKVKSDGAQAANTEQAKLARQDSVSITPQAKQLTELQKKAADAPVMDQKKIEKLKMAISSGEYKVNPEKLAASISNFEFNLL